MSTKIKVEQDDGRLIIRVISHDTEVSVSVPSDNSPSNNNSISLDKSTPSVLLSPSPPSVTPVSPTPSPQPNTTVLKFLKRKDASAETKTHDKQLIRPKIPAQKSYRDAALFLSSCESKECDDDNDDDDVLNE